MDKIRDLMESELKSCLEGGLIEGLSRIEQINRDIKIMKMCGFIDDAMEQQLLAMVKDYYENGYIVDCGKQKKLSEL